MSVEWLHRPLLDAPFSPIPKSECGLNVISLLQGLGTDEESLIEILCSRSNDELIEIKKVYKECKWKKCFFFSVCVDVCSDYTEGK